MTAPPDHTTTDTSAIIAALRAERDAGLAREATLAEALTTRTAELAERTAELAGRNSEYGEWIEHQAATIDVLKAMSASPGDPQPVFDLIVRHSTKLCNVPTSNLFEYDGELVHIRSTYRGETITEPGSMEVYSRQFPMRPPRGSIACRAILDRQIIHVRDMETEPGLLAIVRDLGHRSQVSVPLLRDGTAVGVISIAAYEPGGFTDSQIALLQTFAEQAVIAISSAETYRALQTRTSDLQESLAYQTATSDVLKVISRSTFDLKPVLAAVAETAARLCVADQAVIIRSEGELWRFAANLGFPPEYETYLKALGPMKPDPASPTIAHRTATEGRPVHIDDVAAVPGYPEALIKLGKQRTALGVPLLRGGETIGLIQLSRQRVEPFTDRQIELVSTFADQAVIAIENTRLITEQREALEQQTATAEVLQVINASPGNLTPVFDAMLEKAMRLCEAAIGILFIADGDVVRVAQSRNVPSDFRDYLEHEPPRLDGGSLLSRAMREQTVLNVTDLRETAPFRDRVSLSVAAVELGGIRSICWAPLVHQTKALGLFAIFRQEVRAFSDKQIALLENFAAQAVVAMENARLLTEQREALEQQTATAEVLQVINANPGNLTPVFDIILEKAVQLCSVAFGLLNTWDGEALHIVATHGLPAALYERLAARGPTSAISPAIARLLKTKRPVHVPDVMTGEGYRNGHPDPRALVELGGARTFLAVPLGKDEAMLGYIAVYRQEVRDFSDNEIALLENFAAQAVIAMENARLLTEQREALEQQTATAEVLQVINASPGDLGPVFEAILEKAHSLCDVAVGSLSIYLNGLVHTAATRGFTEEYQALLRRPYYPAAVGSHQALMRGGPSRQTPDIRTVPVSPEMASSLDHSDHLGRMNLRTGLWVPLRKDGTALGCISSYRDRVQPFSEKEIALLENFAAQAVIAMENARLLDEIRQRQEELRITFENMGDGVAMFDETQHLVAWNGKFQDILDVPDDIIARRQTFTEYVRYLAERGEYGSEADPEEHVRGLIEQAGQSRTYERTRPDGRVIEIRHNPVPGGGFVLIYADITERKRSEAEIRAARDAAEEASRTIEAAYRERKTAQANLIQAEKMASLGQLTAGIAHEIKNPLNFVNNFAALSVDLLGELKETAAPGFAALTEKQRAEVEEVSVMLTSNLEKITEHGKRADNIVKAMLEHSRGSSGERRTVDLNTLIDEALNLAYHGARAQDQSFNITLERDFGDGIAPIEVNPQDITRVFLNLFANGFYAITRRSRDGGDARFEPTLKVITRDAGQAVEIRVWDNGTGIPADIRDKLFQPFFTTKPTGEGTGLGLSITYDIVTQQHGGSIAVDSKVGDYSEFTIRLPRKP